MGLYFRQCTLENGKWCKTKWIDLKKWNVSVERMTNTTKRIDGCFEDWYLEYRTLTNKQVNRKRVRRNDYY